MSRFFGYLIVCLLVPAGAIFGQEIDHIRSKYDIKGPQLRQACDNRAGTVTIGPIKGQSNTSGGGTIYLCFGDSISIKHNGDFVINDPDRSTLSGIKYLVTTCPPSEEFAGPDVPTIQKEPCLFPDATITIGPNTFSKGDYWTISDPIKRNGDIVIRNLGGFIEGFGKNKPVSLYLTPITSDDFAGDTNEAGGCVVFNPEATFRVVLLKPVDTARVRTKVDNAGCTGSFIVGGGVPEFDPNERFTITVVNEDDPSVVGVAKASSTNNNTARHLDSVAFFVPQPGRYIITITDGRNCNKSFAVNMAGCQAVGFQLPFLNAKTGDEICVDLKTTNFTKVGLFEMNIRWDTAVLEFVRTQNFNAALGGFGAGSIGQTSDKLGLALSWSDNTLRGVTLADSSTLVTFCFRVKGALGTTSPLHFEGSRDPSETVGTPDPARLGYVFRDGRVNVSDDVLFTSVKLSGLQCSDKTDGVIEVIADKGVAPYTVSLRKTAPTAQNFQDEQITKPGGSFRWGDLDFGTYVVTIQDNSRPTANTKTYNVEFARPQELGVVVEVLSEVLCHDSKTGKLRGNITVNSILVPNPDSTFKFQWNIPGKTTPIVDSLGSGSYSVTVTDSKGCFSSASGGLTAPLKLDPIPDVKANTCSGVSDGSITLKASGGVPFSGGRYIFKWSTTPADTLVTSVISNLTEGNYAVTISDSRKCSKVFTFPVEPFKVLTIDTAVTDVSCFGLSNGTIFAAGQSNGGSLLQPVTFTWTGTTVTPKDTLATSILDGVPAGTYIVTMQDADPAGCRVSDTIIVKQPTQLSVAQGRLQNETCRPGNDGLASIKVSGGTKPYAYEWRLDTLLLTAQTDSLATGLRSGNYVVTVIDSNRCDTTFMLDINAPAGPQITQLNDFTLRCFGDANGRLSVRATPVPGTTITSYTWDNQSSGQDLTNLPAGRYIVTVTGSDFCSSVDTAQVIAPTPISVDSITAVAPRCPGEANGSLTVNVSGGTAPYKFLWKDQGRDTSRFQLRPALKAGIYDVSVFDASGCPSVTGSATLQDPPRIVITFTDSTGVACFEGSKDGRATATAQFSDGTSGLFEFTWQGSQETFAGVASSTATMLSAGMNVVVVVDSNSCAAADSVLITSPPEIKILAVVEAVTCFGQANGKVKLTPGGGTPPFSIAWQGIGSTQDSLSNLQAGTYTAVITDSRNCPKTQEIEIKEPAELKVEVDQSFSRASSCSNTNDGRFGIVVNTDEGINPLPEDAFTWSGGISRPNSPFAEKLAPGTYSVTVTDTKNCTDSTSYTVVSPPPVIGLLNPVTEPRCFGDATTLTVDTAYGGNGVDLTDFTFTVDNNGISFPLNQAANIFAGQHIVAIEDQLGCQYIDTIVVNQPEQLSVSFNPNQVTVELGDSLQLTPIVTSTKPITGYEWLPAKGLSDNKIESPYVLTATRTERDMRDDTEFILTVTDTSGCKAEGTIFVELDRNRNFYIPNAFSPNGDGRNDEFRVFGCKGVKTINYARMFDRWGNQILEAKGIVPDCAGGTIVWDGLLSSKLANQGVYVYIIEVEFLDDVKLLYRGDVGLIR
ncbi:gliding motility-associated C-terminal domain-containing protein [Haliscomenobacter sp.]|uniref:T9SS type B sorting domain-containing protein n=1 Tax=Haliscomenobacter sp. TaxID=2717303 RepID=UPI003BA8C0C4